MRGWGAQALFKTQSMRGGHSLARQWFAVFREIDKASFFEMLFEDFLVAERGTGSGKEGVAAQRGGMPHAPPAPQPRLPERIEIGWDDGLAVEGS